MLFVSPRPSLSQNNFQTDGGRRGGDPDRTKLAKRSVVLHVVGHDIGGFSLVGECQADFMGSQDRNASKYQDGSSSCLQSERRKLQEKGFSLDAVNLIQSSVSSGTTDQYVYKWKLFETFCQEISVDPFNASEAVITNFLAFIKKERNLSYSTICGYRSAISRYHTGISGINVGSSPRVRRLIKGTWRENPPLPKYTQTLNVQRVFDFLSNQHPPSNLDLKMLSYKTLSLIALAHLLRWK